MPTNQKKKKRKKSISGTCHISFSQGENEFEYVENGNDATSFSQLKNFAIRSFNQTLHLICTILYFPFIFRGERGGRVNKTCAQMFTAKYYYHISNSSTKLRHELDSFQKLAQLSNQTIVLDGAGERGRELVAFCRLLRGLWVE